MLVAGTALFALVLAAGGLAPNSGTLVAARLAQGVGAALMSPAALSHPHHHLQRRHRPIKALGAWGAIGGLASAVGVFLGGVLSAGRAGGGCCSSTCRSARSSSAAAFRLVDGEPRRRRRG